MKLFMIKLSLALLIIPSIALSKEYPLPEVGKLVIDESLVVKAPYKDKLSMAVSQRNYQDIYKLADEVELAEFYKNFICFIESEGNECLKNILGYRGRISNLGVILGDYYLAKAQEEQVLEYYKSAYDFYQEDKSGTHRSAYNSALMLHTGKVRNKEEGEPSYLELFKEAIRLGSYNALEYVISNELISFEEAVKMMSSEDNLVNLLSLGAIYYDGVGTVVDHRKSVKYFNRAYAKYKNQTAAFASAQIYYDDLKESSLAKEYYTYASELGHCEAKNGLGIILFEENKHKSALLKFDEAYSCGSLDAGFNKGIITIESGAIKEGISLLDDVSTKGYSKASFNLGLYYLMGKYVKKDLSIARDYLELAKKQGHNKADNFLRKIIK